MAFTIGQCVANLPAKFGNRLNVGTTTDGSIGIIAVSQVVAELTETYEFEELKYQTPVPPLTTLALTVNNSVVTIASLLATIAANTNYPQFQSIAAQFVDITDVYTFWIWFAGGVNQAGRTLKYRRVTTIDQYSYGITSNQQGSLGVAPPTYYTRFGNVLQVGPIPDQPYQFFVRVKLRQPIPATSVAGQVVFVPSSWQEIIEYCACRRLALWEGASEYQELYEREINTKLAGAMTTEARIADMQRMERHNERQLSVRIAQYTCAK